MLQITIFLRFVRVLVTEKVRNNQIVNIKPVQSIVNNGISKSTSPHKAKFLAETGEMCTNLEKKL